MKKFGMYFWMLAYPIVIFLSFIMVSCAPILKTNGEILPDADIQKLRVGVLKKSDVQTLLGYPSVRSTFDDDYWYYIGQNIEERAFQGPVVRDQKILIVSFDEKEVLDAYAVKTLKDYQEITYINEATPTSGHKLGALEQLIGNYGRFSSLPKDADAP